MQASPDDTADWLMRIGFGDYSEMYVESFKAMGVDGADLKDLYLCGAGNPRPSTGKRIHRQHTIAVFVRADDSPQPQSQKLTSPTTRRMALNSRISSR